MIIVFEIVVVCFLTLIYILINHHGFMSIIWFKTKMKMTDLSLISLFCIDIVGYEIEEV